MYWLTDQCLYSVIDIWFGECIPESHQGRQLLCNSAIAGQRGGIMKQFSIRTHATLILLIVSLFLIGCALPNRLRPQSPWSPFVIFRAKGESKGPPCFFSKARAAQSTRWSERGGPKICSPTGSPVLLRPQGMEIPGIPASDAGAVNISHIYMVRGSSTFSPIGNASMGDVGPTMRSTSSKADLKSSWIRRRTFKALI